MIVQKCINLIVYLIIYIYMLKKNTEQMCKCNQIEIGNKWKYL